MKDLSSGFNSDRFYRERRSLESVKAKLCLQTLLQFLDQNLELILWRFRVSMKFLFIHTQELHFSPRIRLSDDKHIILEISLSEEEL